MEKIKNVLIDKMNTILLNHSSLGLLDTLRDIMWRIGIIME